MDIFLEDSAGACEPVEAAYMGDGVVYLGQRRDSGSVGSVVVNEEQLRAVLAGFESRAMAA